jgi:hypothetical protein
MIAEEATTLAEALAEQYKSHGLPPDGGVSAPTFLAHIGPLKIPLPNPPARKQAVFFHDTNHVLTGYDTVFSSGEMAIAGFEIGSGCGRYWMAWLINLGMFALGLLFVPGAMFRAFVRGSRSSSIYRRPEDRTVLLNFTVSELRQLASLDRDAAPPRPVERLRFLAWSIAAIAMVFALLVLLLAAIRLAI